MSGVSFTPRKHIHLNDNANEFRRATIEFVNNSLPIKLNQNDIKFTNPREIQKYINSLPLEKSAGHDLILNIVLKIKNLTMKSLAFLTTLFNRCLKMGSFHDEWNHAEIILI